MSVLTAIFWWSSALAPIFTLLFTTCFFVAREPSCFRGSACSENLGPKLPCAFLPLPLRVCRVLSLAILIFLLPLLLLYGIAGCNLGIAVLVAEIPEYSVYFCFGCNSTWLTIHKKQGSCLVRFAPAKMATGNTPIYFSFFDPLLLPGHGVSGCRNSKGIACSLVLSSVPINRKI